MSAQTLYVDLKARDGLSQPFRVIGQSAASAATAITTSFRTATAGLQATDTAAIKAAADVDRLGNELVEAGAKGATGVGKISASLADFNAKNAAAGLAIGTLVGLLSDATRAAAEEAAGLDRLEQAVTNTGAAYDSYATAIDQAVARSQELSFADDQAVDALNTLTSITGSAETALENLALAQDLARGKGISLATASLLVGKVAAGNLEVLSRYGIVLEEGATATEALTLLQQRYSGQSERFAATQAGQAQRLRNDFDNLVESIGANTGELQSLLLILPGATSGFQLLSGAVGGLLKVDRSSFAGLTRTLGGLAGAINPVTLGFGAAAAAAGVAILAFQQHQQEAEDLATSYGTLNDAIAEVVDTESRQTLIMARLDPSDLSEAYSHFDQAFLQANNAMGAYTLEGAEVTRVNAAMAESASVAGDDIARVASELNELSVMHKVGVLSGEDLVAVLDDLNAVLRFTGDGMAEARAEAFRLVDIINQGGPAAEQAKSDLDALGSSVVDFATNVAIAAADATPIMDDLTRSVTNAYAAINQGVDTEALRQFREDAELAREEAERFFDTQRRIAASLSNDPAAIGLSFPTPSDAAANAIGLKAASEARAANRTEEHARAAEDAARALDEERRAALATADALIGAQDDVTRAAQDAADARADASQEIVAIERERATEQRALERAYAQEVHDSQRSRVEFERDAAREIIELERERREVAIATEEELRDLAEERGEVQLDLTQAVADAETEWLQTSKENLREQAALRSELQRTTAEAAREWQQLNAENLAAQREIKEELRDTLAEQNTDIKRTRQDIARERQRVTEDRDIALSDPTLTPEQRFQIELDASRRLEDLKREEKRAEQDAARAQKEAREQAREEEQQLAQERKAAAQDYHSEVQGLEEQTNARIQDLERERQAASAAFADQRAEAEADAASRLSEIADQERTVLEEQGRRFAEIEREKELAARNTARERQNLEREIANEAERNAREVAQVEREAARETGQVQAEAQQDVIANETELQRLRDEGLITQGEYERALVASRDIQVDSKAIEDEKLAAQARQLPALAEAVERERERVAAARDYNDVLAERADPLDGPPRAAGARALTVDVSVDTAGIAKAVDEELAKIAERSVTIPILARTTHGNVAGDRATAPVGTNEPISSAIEGVVSALDGLEAREVTVEIAADTGAFWSAVRAITSRDSVGATKIIVSADTANADVTAATRSAGTLAASTFTADLTLDSTAFTLALANAQRDGDAFAAQQFTTTLAAELGTGEVLRGTQGPLLGALVKAKTALDLYVSGGEEGTSGWTTTLLADASAIDATIDDVETRLGEISELESEIAVKANLNAFWRAVREIDGDTVATARIAVVADIVDEGGGGGGGSAVAAGRAATIGTSAFGEFGSAPVALAQRPNQSVINTYGPLYVTAASPDIHREIARRLATAGR